MNERGEQAHPRAAQRTRTTLVVVVPTFNEVGNLARFTDRLFDVQLPDIDVRLLVVDDGSTDGTAAVAERLSSRPGGHVAVMQRGSKRGLGVLKTMTETIADPDLVLASRYVRGGVDAQWGWHRKLLSWSANRLVVPALLSLPVTDATSGFRVWRRDALARIARRADTRSTGYGFQPLGPPLPHVGDQRPLLDRAHRYPGGIQGVSRRDAAASEAER